MREAQRQSGQGNDCDISIASILTFRCRHCRRPGALLATCAGNFGFISVMKLIYVWDDIWTNFAIWRLLTPFLFVGKFDFNTLMCLYMLQSFSQRYETEPYNTGAGGGTADYIAMIMVRTSEAILTTDGNLVTYLACSQVWNGDNHGDVPFDKYADACGSCLHEDVDVPCFIHVEQATPHCLGKHLGYTNESNLPPVRVCRSECFDGGGVLRSGAWHCGWPFLLLYRGRSTASLRKGLLSYAAILD